MRIGIDARFLTHPQAGGFKTYSVNLLSALGEIDAENQYIVYVDRPLPEHVARPSNANFVWRIVPGTQRLIGMPWREQVRLRWQISQDRLDLVHFLCNTAPVGLPNHYVITLHDTIQVTAKRSWINSLAGFKQFAITEYSRQSILHSVRRADCVITVSNSERMEIGATLHIPLERIIVTHLAPNPLFHPPTDEERQTARHYIEQQYGVSGRYVLGVGYEPRKNILLLIQAFSELAREFEQFCLIAVVAEDHQRRHYQEVVAQMGLIDRVRLIGAVPPDAMALLYGSAEVFVFPSIRESFGLPPIEAMACGTPTIAMGKSSIPEVVQDGALLVDSVETRAWVDAIRLVLSNDELRVNLRSRGLYRATQLSWHRCAEETLSVYRSIIAHAPAPYSRTLPV
ncbi:MAG: glycosyltransferase family 4 protein [Caldilinea sp.]